MVRSQVLITKATEICEEVTFVGGQFMSAIEKENAEPLALLRYGHKRPMLALGGGPRQPMARDDLGGGGI